MSRATADERVQAAHRLFESEGLADVRVRAAGHESEIAAVSAPHDCAGRLSELVPALKRLGFRYVALDLRAGA